MSFGGCLSRILVDQAVTPTKRDARSGHPGRTTSPAVKNAVRQDATQLRHLWPLPAKWSTPSLSPFASGTAAQLYAINPGNLGIVHSCQGSVRFPGRLPQGRSCASGHCICLRFNVGRPHCRTHLIRSQVSCQWWMFLSRAGGDVSRGSSSRVFRLPSMTD
jgi:hypothetical protein